MVDRFLAWVGAGVVTAGVSVAMIAGAGLAAADDDSASGGAGGTPPRSSSSSESKEDSKQGAPGSTGSSATRPDSKSDDAADDDSVTKAPLTNADDQTTDTRHMPFGRLADTDRDDDTSRRTRRDDPLTATAGGLVSTCDVGWHARRWPSTTRPGPT